MPTRDDRDVIDTCDVSARFDPKPFRENSRESREPHENLVLGWGALDRYPPLLALEHFDGLARRALDRLDRVDVWLDLWMTVGESTL